MDLQYLTVEQVVFIHDEIIKKSGGSFGVRDWDLLHSAVFRSQASFAGKDLYSNIFLKTGALWQSLSKNHGFIDGNKRTSSSSSFLFLEINNINIKVAHVDLIKFAVDSENKNYSVKKIATWLKDHIISS